MPYKQPIEELSRQPLIKGTTKFTDPSGNLGYSNEEIITSALVRIAGALETGRLQLPTAVFPIQPQHADEFRTLVADLVADRPGRVYIVAWHLKDEYTVDVTLAYERGESLIYLGRYWEAQRREDLSTPKPENKDEPATWLLPNYCDSRDVQREINEQEADNQTYVASMLRRFLQKEASVRQLLSDDEEGGQRHD